MPTIIALDMSLSMTKTVPAVANGSNEDSVTYHQLAVQAIHEFLNYLTEHSKLEYVAFVSKRVKLCCFDLNIFRGSELDDGRSQKNGDFANSFCSKCNVV